MAKCYYNRNRGIRNITSVLTQLHRSAVFDQLEIRHARVKPA